MSEQATEQQQPQSSSQQPDGAVRLELRPTGRMHTVTGQGNVQILGEDGEPEKEWALVAYVGGVGVTLESYGVGWIAIQQRIAQAAQQQQQQSG